MPKRPKIHCELLFGSSLSSNNGHILSADNYDGIITSATPMSRSAKWRYLFKMTNNSSVPAFNVKLEQSGNKKLSFKGRLNTFNNLAPLAELTLEREFEIFYVATGDERLFHDKGSDAFPSELNDVCVAVIYTDDSNIELRTVMSYENGKLINTI